jgi:hypothetical protein
LPRIYESVFLPNLYQISAQSPDYTGQIRHSHTFQVFLLLAAGRTSEADWTDARVRHCDANREGASADFRGSKFRQIYGNVNPVCAKKLAFLNWQVASGQGWRARRISCANVYRRVG